MSESLENGKKTDTGAVVDCVNGLEDSSIRLISRESEEKFMNSLSLIDCAGRSFDEQLSPDAERSLCDTENSSISATDQFPEVKTPARLVGCADACAASKESLSGVDDWFADGYSFGKARILPEPSEDSSCCFPVSQEESRAKSLKQKPEVEYSRKSLRRQEKSNDDSYGPSASDLLFSVVQSYREALNDQKIVLARQTDALNRLAAAIESQTKMIDELHKRNRSSI